MAGELAENNMVTIAGKVSTELKYSHEIYGEGFYFFLLDVPRLSSSSDSISVTISERLIGKRRPEVGALVEIEGQFRSYNSMAESGSKLLLTVFSREISFLEDESALRNPNKIFLNGYICKKPVYRCTPFGREITDLLIAVNRAYNKSDYIPCISWGRNARFCSGLSVGDNIKIWGRIQSRIYQKKLDGGAVSERVAYEVSLSKLEIGGARRAGDDGTAGTEAGACESVGAGADERVGAAAYAGSANAAERAGAGGEAGRVDPAAVGLGAGACAAKAAGAPQGAGEACPAGSAEAAAEVAGAADSDCDASVTSMA
jgi:single-stranded DNA-binding protein